LRWRRRNWPTARAARLGRPWYPRWQRCCVHVLRNALEHSPRKAGDDCLMELRWLYGRRDLDGAPRDSGAWPEKSQQPRPASGGGRGNPKQHQHLRSLFAELASHNFLSAVHSFPARTKPPQNSSLFPSPTHQSAPDLIEGLDRSCSPRTGHRSPAGVPVESARSSATGPAPRPRRSGPEPDNPPTTHGGPKPARLPPYGHFSLYGLRQRCCRRELHDRLGVRKPCFRLC